MFVAGRSTNTTVISKKSAGGQHEDLDLSQILYRLEV